MADGLETAEAQAEGRKFIPGKFLPCAEGCLHVGDVRRGVGHTVKLDAIAGVEHREFAHARGGELGMERGHPGVVERELFPHGQRRAMVGGAQQKKSGGTHGCRGTI